MKKRASLFSLFFTFAVDNLSATIVYPIFAPLFLKPSQHLLTDQVSLSYKTTMLGIFLAVFPLMQFIFAPFFGEYADHYGRKRTLLMTTFLTFFGYAISAWGIYAHSLTWIFFGRVMMGIGAGNFSTCLSALSDLSPHPKKRMHYFSVGSAIAGFTFILGPFVGGKLSDPQINAFFGPYFPMMIGAILGFVNIFFILFAFEETLETFSTERFDFIKGIHRIQLVLKTKAIKNLYLVYFFYLFSWNVIFLFVPAFMVEVFSTTNSQIGDICAILGVCWIFGTAVLHRLFYRVFNVKRVMVFALGAFAGVVLFVPFFHHLKSFVFLLGGCTVISGVIWPLCTGAISSAAPQDIQGKTLGLSQSLLSLAMLFASIIGGCFLHVHIIIPFVLSSLSALVGAALLLYQSKLNV